LGLPSPERSWRCTAAVSGLTFGKGSIFQMELPIRAEFRKPVQGSLG
jgi:hypothetical protein